jgi:D-aminoacyl-tRNA deacylase
MVNVTAVHGYVVKRADIVANRESDSANHGDCGEKTHGCKKQPFAAALAKLLLIYSAQAGSIDKNCEDSQKSRNDERSDPKTPMGPRHRNSILDVRACLRKFARKAAGEGPFADDKIVCATAEGLPHMSMLDLRSIFCLEVNSKHMRALVQRVSQASVVVSGAVTGQIGRGLLVFLGIRYDDTEAQAEHLAQKVIRLRIFPDDTGKMNRSVNDISGELLIVSQFTLYGDTRKGNRPSYTEAARPESAERLYEYFVKVCRDKGVPVATGVFQAHMEVHLINDGPVTLMCYSES